MVATLTAPILQVQRRAHAPRRCTVPPWVADDVTMGMTRHTDVEVSNPSRLQQRLEAAQRQADAEVDADEVAVNVRITGHPTRMGEGYTLWWPVDYEVQPKRVDPRVRGMSE
jgi:hypothetical protein